MSDNASVVSDSTTEKFKAAADELTYSTDTVKLAIGRLVHVSGAEGSKVLTEIVTAPGAPAAFALTVHSPKPATATLANVAGNASSVTLQASNAARMRLDIYNDSTANLYVKYGSGASTTSFITMLGPGESLREPDYTGIVTGIWDSATGAARMTELTA